MRSILPFVLIVIFGAWRKRSPKTMGVFGLALAALFLVFMWVDPDPRGPYMDAFFFVLAMGIGLQRLGVLHGTKSNP